jgi:flagellar hook-associated protein 3 FlgL
MRISTNTIFANGTNQLGSLQGQLAKTQMQLSTNRRLVTAADDPVAAARALELTQSKSVNEQYNVNRQSAHSSLDQVEGTLSSATTLMQEIQRLAVYAGSGALTPPDREAIAIDLESRMQDLLGVANTADGVGGYLFSGHRADTQPFTQTATGAQYNGDQGQRQIQVGSSRQMPVSETGNAIFERNLTGNGSFQSRASATNTGSGIVSPGSVINKAALTGHNYSVTFTVTAATPPVTTYMVSDTTTGESIPRPPAIATPQAYKSGQQIAFDGMALDVVGDPANGDSFTTEPSVNQSVFTTITDLVTALRQATTGATGKAQLANNLSVANANLASSLDNILSVRASFGSRMQELDYLDSAGSDRDIQYASTLSDLQDLDMVKALSQFAQQQTTLEAAQKSFKALSGLSLFNYIG